MVALTAVNLFNELLLGSGAFVGHILVFLIVLQVKRTFSAGGFLGMLISVAMMLFILTNMPADNDAYIMVMGYFYLAVTSITGNK